MKNILFICSRNKWRSRTAEEIFKNIAGLSVRSAGTNSSARRRLTASDVSWADIICTMEKKHLETLKEKFHTEQKNKEIHVLNIPDDYKFMDEELIGLLKDTMELIMANSEKKENNPCPCGTGELYENCCERFYSGKSFPETAEELMRSRYCAYVMNQLDYLVQTTDPKTRDKNLKASLQTSMDQYEWLQLEIISTAMGQKNDKIAKVEFVARYKTKEGLSDHYEVSKFRKFEGHWVYTGTVDE